VSEWISSSSSGGNGFFDEFERPNELRAEGWDELNGEATEDPDFRDVRGLSLREMIRFEDVRDDWDFVVIIRMLWLN
jgi:hypothetical protein